MKHRGLQLDSGSNSLQSFSCNMKAAHISHDSGYLHSNTPNSLSCNHAFQNEDSSTTVVDDNNLNGVSDVVISELNSLIGKLSVKAITSFLLRTLPSNPMSYHCCSEMMLPSEQKYNLKIQKVQSVMQMVDLKIQSLNLYYKGEVEELNSQRANRWWCVAISSVINNFFVMCDTMCRDAHIQLLEDALQEISCSYRKVVESSSE